MLSWQLSVDSHFENVTYFLASKQYNTQLSSFAMLFVPFVPACSRWYNAH